MSWFGAIYFGEYDVDADAAAPAPPPVVATEQRPTPSDIPTGAGRWVRMPPRYIPIGIEYEPVLLHGKVIVDTRVDVIAEAIVTRDVIVLAGIDVAPPIVHGHVNVVVAVHATMDAHWLPTDWYANGVVTIPVVQCESGMTLCAQAQCEKSLSHVVLGAPHAYFDKLRLRAEEEALLFDFDE